MFSIDKVANAVVEMSSFLNVDCKTVWDKYTHEFITEQFTWEEIESELKKDNKHGRFL